MPGWWPSGVIVFLFSSRRRHTRCASDWSSDVCSSDLPTISRFNLNRPFPEFGSFQQRGRNDGKVWYNSMQIAYQIRGAAGMNLTFAYTFSKMIEQAALSNSFMGAGTSAFTDTQQQIPQRSVYAFDRPHVLKIGTVWELPFGKGKHFVNTSHPVLSRLVSGW